MTTRTGPPHNWIFHVKRAASEDRLAIREYITQGDWTAAEIAKDRGITIERAEELLVQGGFIDHDL